MRQAFFRISVHPFTLAAWTVVVMAMVVTTGWAHVEALIGVFGADGLDRNLVLEEDVAVILVAVGVYLEERGLLSNKAFGANLGDRQEALNEVSECYGAYLLMLGLLMEVNDQSFEPLLVNAGLAEFGIGLMVALDALAFVLCAFYLVRLVRPHA